MQRFKYILSILGIVVACILLVLGGFMLIGYFSGELELGTALLVAGFLIVPGLVIFFFAYRGITSWHKHRGTWEKHKESLRGISIGILVPVGIIVGLSISWWAGGAIIAAGVLIAFLLSRAAKDRQQDKGVVASHPKALHQIVFTDESVQTKKNRFIPYSSIIDCSLLGSALLASWGIKWACMIKYIDRRGKVRKEKFKGRSPYSGVAIYTDILRVSKQHGYEVAQQPHEAMVLLAKQLNSLDVESEFIEPDPLHNAASPEGCHIEHGGLKLKQTNIDEVWVSRDAWTEYQPSMSLRGSETALYQRFNTNCVVQRASAPATSGKLGKKSILQRAEYRWQGSGLAEILNGDDQLRKMLVESKAPPIEVKGNCISTEKFLTLNLFRCIDRIASHVRQKATQ